MIANHHIHPSSAFTAVSQFVLQCRPRGAHDPIKQIRCQSRQPALQHLPTLSLSVCSSPNCTIAGLDWLQQIESQLFDQSRKLATSAAKPLLLLSRTQLRCFHQPGNIMTAALAMAMMGVPVMTPNMASPVRCESYSVKKISRGEHFGAHFGSSSRAIATPSNSRVKPLPVLMTTGARAACTIAEGSKLPEADLSYFDKDGNVHTVKVSELTRAKKVVLFAVPGAFTPTCSTQHVPGFVAKAEDLRKAGVDVLACVSVNDAFVMRAWGEQMKVGEEVLLLSDGLGKFTKAMGATVDLSDKPVGLGVRSRRYAMVVDDGVVKALNIEEGGAFTHSSAEDILKCLQKHKAPNVECSAGQNVM